MNIFLSFLYPFMRLLGLLFILSSCSNRAYQPSGKAYTMSVVVSYGFGQYLGENVLTIKK